MTLRGSGPLALLLSYGIAFAAWALGASLIGFDDHPGQLYRVWHVLIHGPAPWAWNPGWWGGYPELQFYPPGFAYAVALVHVASARTLSVAASYQAFVWLAYLAPAITVWLLLRRVVRDGWAALPGAFVALTLSADLGSGVEGGVHTGMVPARLAWALLPVIALVAWPGAARGVPWPVAPLVAAVALIHPAHLPAAVVIAVLAAWLAPSPRRLAWVRVAITVALAAGLTAFWTVPLLAHVEHTRALAWGALSARDVFAHPLAVVLAAVAVLDLLQAVLGLLRRPRPRDLAGALRILAWAMPAIVLFDAVGLEPLGLRWLPADRVADSAWLALVLLAGATAGRWIAAAGAGARPALALAAVALTIAISVPARTLTLWPPLPGWERAATIEGGLRLPALWSALREAPAGRVLFVRSGVPLVYGADWWRPHSHVTALTPLTAGRDIVNGTFTHPSPLAAFLYRGDAGRGAIRELVERLDGRRLFGRDLDGLDAETFNRHADRLGVGAVVALDEDRPRLRALRDNPQFSRSRSSPPFVIYLGRSGGGMPGPLGSGRLGLRVDAARETWIPARMAYYPLWRATSDGRPLATRRGEMGDLEVQSPGPGARLDLVYERGAAETSGLAISALSLATLVTAWTMGSFQERRARSSKTSRSNAGSVSPKTRSKFASWSRPSLNAWKYWTTPSNPARATRRSTIRNES